MDQRVKTGLLATTAVGLLSASLIGFTRLPAASNAEPDNRTLQKCGSLKPCFEGKNHGSGGGLYGVTTKPNGGNGVSGFGSNPVASGVYGIDLAGGYGVSGSTQGTSGIGAGLYGLSGNANPALILQVGTAAGGNPILRANNGAGQVALLDDSGNFTVTGLLYSAGSCATGCSRTRHVGSYTPREASPTMEDVGEAQLVGGRADVGLDHAFANAIDANAGYSVLITPEGDSKGLYVASRTAGGFEVRENQGGRSNVGFAYRIVAHAYGVKAPRLPVIVDRPGVVQPKLIQR